ncbi:dolichyl pyrophosphate Glc1Man9GlcNAc2 alpha-1,3-glucosyltransferase isoform X2 [Halyomorpha halys]|uniref:dolichyl pyrophosphate Glc1Man9GlcNAc2 alpha-1,3-glucosyltransferase isoform X2 n=1 Tax=Halyomorpha halys TaxID=286706 RepID=UPI0034D289AB
MVLKKSLKGLKESKSTDFEVHRNWLAITFSNPISRWYFEESSIWTIDYPPFFAWFEYLLSLVAYFFDSDMLGIRNQNYDSPYTIYFQRFSVIACDLVLLYGCKEVSDFMTANPVRRKSSKWKLKWRSPASTFFVLVLANFGLFIVDHIHFQYNGFLLGILLVSIAKIMKGHHLSGAFWFAVLLNLKHIYIYMAPAYGVYLIRNYCLVRKRGKIDMLTSLWRLTKLAGIGSVVLFISFGPFVFMGQLKQLILRLFPFKRGLCHSYWAPNFWAFYNVIDKMLSKIIVFLYPDTYYPQGVMTSGLVQEYEHYILPSIYPSVTAALVVISMMPCLWKLWVSPGNPLHFVRAVILCTSCSFLFGWHVHEKAVLMIIIPQSLMAVLGQKEAEVFSFFSIVGHFSLLPLIYTQNEFIIKLVLLTIYSSYMIYALADLFRSRCYGPFPLLSIQENIYLAGLILLFIYENIIHTLYKVNERYPFLPLLLTSFYCSFGIIYSTFKYYVIFIKMKASEHKHKMY